MRKICILIFLISNFTWSQETILSGIIKDSETLQPIPFVNIYVENDLKNNYTGSISNENGEFSIINNNSQLIFSHISYESLTINSDENLEVILLKPKSYILDEIVISNQTPKEYLNEIISLSSSAIEKNTLFKTYCREIVKVNDEYTKFSDALVDYYVTKENGNSNVFLNQHRALKSNKLDDKDDEIIDEINSMFNVKDYIKNAYEFNGIENLLKNDDYEFEIKIKKDSNGEEYEHVRIIPNEESKEMLNKGYIIVDPKSKKIVEYKIYTSKNHLKNAELKNLLIAKAKINKMLVWSKFKIINDQYILTYNKKQVEMYIKIGKRIDHIFDFASDVFVYEFKNDAEIQKKRYHKKTLFKAGTSYTENFWEKYNIFPLSENEEKFVNSIQQN
jgi:hypothetical protein